jgi:hypothetical protein
MSTKLKWTSKIEEEEITIFFYTVFRNTGNLCSKKVEMVWQRFRWIVGWAAFSLESRIIESTAIADVVTRIALHGFQSLKSSAKYREELENPLPYYSLRQLSLLCLISPFDTVLMMRITRSTGTEKT